MKKLLFIILITLLICACETGQSHKASALPVGAINVVDKGNNWVEFTLDGKRFLYHKSTGSYSGYECITQIK